ncbi:trypsin-like peptidase domain-containing protein [Streptomyces ovatisporus]|uniref:Trypsin-like peptidase domain-containing protein n=1 Tax=Streptomyces ovatisporus TaxID=1128682 RepID=A0ABV8ZYR6_9ACTN
MKRPLVGSLAAALFAAVAVTGAAATPAAAAEQQSPRSSGSAAAAPDFAGTVALSNCSGSLVKMPESKATDPGLVLSNGHCLEEGMPEPGKVVVDQPSQRGFSLLDASGGEAGQLTATKISYATMTDTDVSLYELDATYEEIKNETGIDALEVQAEHPEAGTAITVVSGYWKETYSCSLDGFVHELREDGWTMKDSLRYTDECDTKGGTSGSPVVDDASGKIVGVNNTRNENGQECTLNNPCEVDENGKVTVNEGTAYGQQTHTLTSCIAAGNKVDLSLPDCKLPKP